MKKIKEMYGKVKYVINNSTLHPFVVNNPTFKLFFNNGYLS